MTNGKTAATAKKTATGKAPAVAKRAAKPAVKPPAKKAAATPQVAEAKQPKAKVVHDSFSMPKAEYLKIGEIKEICRKAGLPVKKSTVLRAGLKVLAAMSAAQLKAVVAGLETVKTGRPKKS